MTGRSPFQRDDTQAPENRWVPWQFISCIDVNRGPHHARIRHAKTSTNNCARVSHQP